MAEDIPFYIGTYTGGASKGIYRSTLNLDSGACAEPTLAAETTNPSFLAVHPNKKFLYAVNEVGQYKGTASGSISAFAIREDGSLEHLNTQSSHGGAPCHLVVDATGSFVLVANYSGGSIASLPIRDDGALGGSRFQVQHTGASVNKRRQKSPHAHSINLDATNRRALVGDLGLDKVLVYAFDPETGSLGDEAIANGVVAPGAGPRHVAIHQDRVYAINELDSTITVFHYESSSGTLTPRQAISTLPAGFKGRSHTAEVRVSPDGQFVYGSNRGHDSIAVFKASGADGELTLLEIEPTQGKTPRNFAIDPSGAFLLAENQGSGTINVFRIDRDTGELDPTEHHLTVPSPVCIRFLE